MELTLGEITRLVQGHLTGDPDRVVQRVAGLREAGVDLPAKRRGKA